MGLMKDYKTTRLYFVSFESPNLLGWDGTDLDKIRIAILGWLGKMTNVLCYLL